MKMFVRYNVETGKWLGICSGFACQSEVPERHGEGLVEIASDSDLNQFKMKISETQHCVVRKEPTELHQEALTAEKMQALSRLMREYTNHESRVSNPMRIRAHEAKAREARAYLDGAVAPTGSYKYLEKEAIEIPGKTLLDVARNIWTKHIETDIAVSELDAVYRKAKKQITSAEKLGEPMDIFSRTIWPIYLDES